MIHLHSFKYNIVLKIKCPFCFKHAMGYVRVVACTMHQPQNYKARMVILKEQVLF